MMCLAIAVNLPPVYLTTFGETFGGADGLTSEQMGRIPAFVFASLTLGILISGPLADRWGGKLFATLGLALIIAGLALMGAAQSYPVLLAAGCLMGLGAGILDMVLSPIVCALRPGRRSTAMNWLHSFYCTGAVGTVVIGSTALRLNISWRSVALGVTVFPAALLVGFAMTKIPSLVQEVGRRDGLPRLLMSPFFLAALAAILLGGATEQGMGQWLPTFAETTMGYGKSLSGFFLAAFLVAMTVGRVLAALLGSRIRPFRLVILSCVLSVFLYLIGCFCPWRPVALSACIALGFTGSCLWPTTLGLTADRFPNGGASMFGLLAAFGNTGCFLMPWVIGVVAQHSNLNWGLATAAIAPAAMAGVLVWMWTRHADLGTEPQHAP